MLRPSCDTAEGVAVFLRRGLEGLHELARQRADARADTRLRNWLVAGRYLLDDCGQMQLVSLSVDNKPLNPDVLSPVVERDALFSMLKVRTTSWFEFIPTNTTTCGECGRRFDVKSARYAWLHRDKEFMHRECARLFVERRGLATIRAIFDEAGLGKAVLQPIPNEYWNSAANADDPDARPVTPWVLARLPYGVIKFGSRKRVDELDWSDVIATFAQQLQYHASEEMPGRLSAEALFPDEKVTKSAFLIHAWTDAKAVEYLRVVDKAIGDELGRT